MSEEVVAQPVYAVAISANQATISAGAPRASKEHVERIQQAMSNAVAWCYKNGVTDPEAIKEKMQQARAAVKRKFAEESNPTR